MSARISLLFSCLLETKEIAIGTIKNPPSGSAHNFMLSQLQTDGAAFICGYNSALSLFNLTRWVVLSGSGRGDAKTIPEAIEKASQLSLNNEVFVIGGATTLNSFINLPDVQHCSIIWNLMNHQGWEAGIRMPRMREEDGWFISRITKPRHDPQHHFSCQLITYKKDIKIAFELTQRLEIWGRVEEGDEIMVGTLPFGHYYNRNSVTIPVLPKPNVLWNPGPARDAVIPTFDLSIESKNVLGVEKKVLKLNDLGFVRHLMAIAGWEPPPDILRTPITDMLLADSYHEIR